MDRRKAEKLASNLIGKQIGEYSVVEFINNGKSAAVFKAMDAAGIIVALKIFDNEIIERFGHEIQLRRIKQEIALKGHCIKGLINIIEGGTHRLDGEEYFYIVMEFIQGQNLKEFIETEQYDEEFAKRVMLSLIAVTEELLKKKLAHRDIKPENIMISNAREVVLMDLGVLKLVNDKSYSDAQEKQFLGTLRYSPPEFLARKEEDSIDGWRAVNIYQIGAVLHDMIERKELFLGCEPFSQLVMAIFNEQPGISSSLFSYQICQIARNCLSKDWIQRLELCDIESIKKFCLNVPSTERNLESVVNSVFKDFAPIKHQFVKISDLKRSYQERITIAIKQSTIILEFFMLALKKVALTKICNIEEIKSMKMPCTDYSSSGRNRQEVKIIEYADTNIDGFVEKTLVVVANGEIDCGFICPLAFIIRLQNSDSPVVIISGACFFSQTIQLNNPAWQWELIQVFKTIKQRNAYFDRPYELETATLYKGSPVFNEQFSEEVAMNLIRLMKTALISAKSVIANELDKIDMTNYNPRNSLTIRQIPPIRVFNTLSD